MESVIPRALFKPLVKTILASMTIYSGKAIRELGAAVTAIERCPRHAKSSNYTIAIEQAGPRGAYWQVNLQVRSQCIELSAYELYADFDGNWEVIRGFSEKLMATHLSLDSPDSVLGERKLMEALVSELQSERKWIAHIFREAPEPLDEEGLA